MRLKVTLGAVAVLLPALCAAETAKAPPEVALVAAIEGAASIRKPQRRAAEPLQAFEWLAPNTQIETGADARVTIAFRSGDRYEVGALSSVFVSASEVKAGRGHVRKLEPLPPLPSPIRFARGTVDTASAGAVRIRGQRGIGGIYPQENCTSLADDTLLRFDPANVTPPYHLAIEDESGKIIYKKDTTTARVTVEPGILQDGARYVWRVSARSRLGPVLKSDAEFMTLPAEAARQRKALREALAGSGEVGAGSLAGAYAAIHKCQCCPVQASRSYWHSGLSDGAALSWCLALGFVRWRGIVLVPGTGHTRSYSSALSSSFRFSR